MVWSELTPSPLIYIGAVLVAPNIRVTLSFKTFAGMSWGTKVFSLVWIGMYASSWNPITAAMQATRRMGTGFFAIFTDVLVSSAP